MSRVLRLVVVLVLAIFGIFFTSCGGNANSGGSGEPAPAAPSLTFSASSTSVTAGQSVTLSWTAKNATSVTISPSIGSGALPLSGSQAVTVSSQVTYTATANGAGGKTTKTVTINVSSGAAPTVSFTASASSVAAGSIVTLTWSTTNATSFTVSPSILGEDQTSLALSGSTTVVINATTTYTATATGAGGTATQSVTITATATAPTITLAASPASVAAGAASTLTWTTTNATSVSIDHGVGSGLAANGSATVNPSATTTYTATATGASGTATATATVTVTSGLAITLTASPTTIVSGGNSTLSWSTSGGAGTVSVTISGVSGTQAASGSVSVTPTSTTTYTATATDSGSNTATDSATVTVATSTGGINTLKHIIFMVQENRTFDNYFGKLGAYRASRVSGASPSDVNDLDTLPSGFGLKTRSDAPDPGFVVPPFHERTLQTENLSPSWNESHYDAHIVGNNYLDVTSSSQFKMDNFLQTTTSVTQKYDPDGTRPMGYYDQTDLPYYYELASQFAISDNFHSPILSQTNPNRMYLFAATSIGRCNADPTGHAPWPAPTIFDELQSAGVFWRYYYQDGVFLSQFASWNNPSIAHQVWNISNLFTILASPTADRDLPQFVFIERGETTDEHPDNNIQAGAAYVKSIIDALMASNAWQDSVFILTYDEGGGLYDHVPPFLETEPDDIAPNCPTLTPANFNLSGFRLPVIVISPYAIPHYVSHTPMDTTSVLNFIEERFNLAPLTKRDAQAPKMDEFFDFSNPAWLTPPPLPDQPNECLTDSSRCSQKLETYPNLP